MECIGVITTCRVSASDFIEEHKENSIYKVERHLRSESGNNLYYKNGDRLVWRRPSSDLAKYNFTKVFMGEDINKQEVYEMIKTLKEEVEIYHLATKELYFKPILLSLEDFHLISTLTSRDTMEYRGELISIPFGGYEYGLEIQVPKVGKCLLGHYGVTQLMKCFSTTLAKRVDELEKEINVLKNLKQIRQHFILE